MTPHNEAKKQDIAKIVLMPGDPLRAKWIAENFLDKYKLVNKIRGMHAYTGFYKNKRITIMAHGMGGPSIGIYSYELFKFYDVDTIIRIGSCGSYVERAPIGSVIVCKEAFSKSNYANELGITVPKNNILKASSNTLNSYLETANRLKFNVVVGKIYSSNCFYDHMSWQRAMKQSSNIIGVEMEAFALYANAIKLNKNALCVTTVTDHYVTNESMTSIQRQTALNIMVEIALETAITINLTHYNAYIDHTLLKPNALQSEIKLLCNEAKKYKFTSVCVNPCHVKFCKSQLENSNVKVCTVIGFPLGNSTTQSKIFEAQDAIENGADEIDMVINISWLKQGKLDDCIKEIKAIKHICKSHTLKVIVETCLLTAKDKINACRCVNEAHADFIKTSTGFNTSGATIKDVMLLKKYINKDIQVKAAGGIKTLASMKDMIEAGASRIGTSNGIEIMKSWTSSN